jgi:aspartate racemase
VRYLGPDQPIYGFQQVLPGLGAGKGNASLEAMAASYIEELLALPSAEPYLLAGYSFGAIVAFEMSRQLTAKGYRVALLAVIDETFPDPSASVSWSFRGLGSFLHNLPFWLWDEFLPRTPRQHYDHVLKSARRFKLKMAKLLGRTGVELLEEDVRDLFSVSRLSEGFRAICEANYHALMGYRTQIYAGKITLFRGRTQPLFCRYGADLGWSKIAAGGLAVNVIPGTHGTILKEPHVKALAEALKEALDGV